jgi:hypothetical protein
MKNKEVIFVRFKVNVDQFKVEKSKLVLRNYDFLINNNPDDWSYVALQEEENVTDFMEAFGNLVPDKEYHVEPEFFQSRDFHKPETTLYARFADVKLFPPPL